LLFVIVIWKNKIRLKINGVCNDPTLTNSLYRINWWYWLQIKTMNLLTYHYFLDSFYHFQFNSCCAKPPANQVGRFWLEAFSNIPNGFLIVEFTSAIPGYSSWYSSTYSTFPISRCTFEIVTKQTELVFTPFSIKWESGENKYCAFLVFITSTVKRFDNMLEFKAGFSRIPKQEP